MGSLGQVPSNACFDDAMTRRILDDAEADEEGRRGERGRTAVAGRSRKWFFDSRFFLCLLLAVHSRKHLPPPHTFITDMRSDGSTRRVDYAAVVNGASESQSWTALPPPPPLSLPPQDAPNPFRSTAPVPPNHLFLPQQGAPNSAVSIVPVHPIFGPQQDAPNDGREDDDMEEALEEDNEDVVMEEGVHHDDNEEVEVDTKSGSGWACLRGRSR